MIASSSFLRRVLALDAAASGATGLLLAAGGVFLADLTGIPVAVAQPLGLFLVAYAALVGWLASRTALPSAAVWAVILVNAAWVAESFLSLATGFLQPTLLGTAFVAVQALAVGAFAILQIVGVRRSPRLAA